LLIIKNKTTQQKYTKNIKNKYENFTSAQVLFIECCIFIVPDQEQVLSF
jgi:hypothetical protein